MDRESTYQLEDLIFDLTEIQASDVLAHVDLDRKEIFQVKDDLFTFPLDTKWNAILKTTVQNKRQSDTDTLCLAVDGLEWEYKGKTVVSPLWLIPATYKINKVKQEIELVADAEHAIFNPFVKNELKRRYDLIWESNELQDISQKLIELSDFLTQAELNFEISRFSAFGNFHHHRFQIVRDLEALTKVELNPLVQEMLGNHDLVERSEILSPDKLTRQDIVSSDKDQQEVFEKFAQGNLVIQGPPGTGKSQVLTNLLAKLLLKGNMNLVVSEKKAALEVLVKKLATYGLDAFTFISHNQTKSSDFISQLKKTWQLLEIKKVQPERNLLLSEQLLDHLQLKLDRLASKELIGGIDLYTFKKLLSGIDISDIPYTSDVPSVAEWLQEKEQIDDLSGKISFKTLKHFKQKGLQDILRLDHVLENFRSEFQELSKALDFETFAGLEDRIRHIPRCQILENESYKKYARLFSSARGRKTFEKLRVDFLKETEIYTWRNEMKIWRELPGLSVSQTWKKQLSEGWWKRRKAEKEIRSMLLAENVSPQIAVENWLIYLEKERQFQHIISELYKLGVERPDVELESIHYLLTQLEKTETTEFSQVVDLPPALRKRLVQSGNRLQIVYREIKEILAFESQDKVLETIETAIRQLPEIIPVQQQVGKIPNQLYRLLQQHHSLQMVEKLVFKSNWTQFESRFPELAKFDGEVLKSTIEKIIDQQTDEHHIFGQNLVFAQYQKFEAFHQLLRTPAAKLKVDEKELKAKLKTGKSILVKEFGKSKQHKTIRELLDSEARIWIEILTPVWLSTPVQVAVSFPMEKELFECVIFDEASQIPLSHALGSLQRAKSAVVAGDEQQMSPGSYFSGVTSGVDLLHQASYHWPKSPLKHHYRSIHPELIAFSNRFFYDDELIAYPSPDREDNPLKLHHVSNGVYDGRQNIVEAKTIAKEVESLVKHPDSLGVVAFSEQQLDCVWKQLSVKAQNELSQRIEEGTAFFKALEQVQGDECDRLLISFGYGKNPEGEFHLRFGPLNQKNGTKRLNVLFSRAKKSIDFYTSIQASDLSLSTNEAINLLRFFLLKTQQDESSQEIVFPFGLKPAVKGNLLEFDNISATLPDAKELVVLYDLLKNRGWNIRF